MRGFSCIFKAPASIKRVFFINVSIVLLVNAAPCSFDAPRYVAERYKHKKLFRMASWGLEKAFLTCSLGC